MCKGLSVRDYALCLKQKSLYQECGYVVPPGADKAANRAFFILLKGNKMTTMKIVLSNVENISPAYRPNENSIKVTCDMGDADMKDIMCQICEQFGDKAFLKLARKITI